MEATADTDKEVRDFLLSCVEDQCNLYGRVWEQLEDIQTAPTTNGHWGRITIWRIGVPTMQRLV